ncbi:MAG: hypothetical protein Q8P83_00770 [bacterium]|nr:hypothetical protein [bacterium]
MIFDQQTTKIVSTFVLIMFISAQFLFISSIFLIPKPAQAFLGIGDVTITLGDIPRYIEQIVTGILRQLALKISDKFINRFVEKLVDKYKIRNFLYYDQILTNFYLNNYIRDKIADPNLRQIYQLLESAYITGQNTGLRDQPNSSNALIPRLKNAIYNQYLKSGGIPEGYIFNPPRNTNSYNYYVASSSYYFMQPSFVERNLRGQFGEFQSAATTAAQLEIIVGNGLKAGRVVGGTCSLDIESSAPDSNPTPTSCTASGGNWNPPALDESRAFIDNPTEFIRGHLDGFIRQKIDSNFAPNNFWAVIGSLVGEFMWSKFGLDQSGGTLGEDPRGYAAQSNREVDIDEDGIPDGYDTDKDGELDICHNGKVDNALPASNSNCQPSSTASSSPYFIPLCRSLFNAIDELEKYSEFINANTFGKVYSHTWLNKTTFVSGTIDDLASAVGQYNIMEYDVALFSMGEYAKTLSKIVKSLAKDEDLDAGFWSGSTDASEQRSLIHNTSEMLEYLTEFRSVIGSCDNPDPDDVSSIDPPVFEYPGGGSPGGGTGVCAGILSPNPKYGSAVEDANNAVLSANPGLAGSANIDRGDSRFQFVALVAEELRAQGYNATDKVLNGNDNPNTGDLVAVWRSSDSTMERYDILTGSGDTIRDAETVQYMATIALTCVE